MARYHYWQYIVDSQGRPLQNVNIRFYLNDAPTEEADIFNHPSLGRTTTTSQANIKTNENGFFEFWIGDEFEEYGGYESTQQFKLSWFRAGILLGTINNIDVFPPILKVDETDNTSPGKDNKNKTISNQLAYNWETHRQETVPSDDPHDLEAVDINDGTDNIYNKLVSNSLMNYIVAVVSSAGTLSIDASAAVERVFRVYSGNWVPSGSLYYVQLDHFIGRKYPLVQVRNQKTNLMFKPAKIKSVSVNSIQLMVSDPNIQAEITIVG